MKHLVAWYIVKPCKLDANLKMKQWLNRNVIKINDRLDGNARELLNPSARQN